MRTIDLESLKIFRTVVDEGGIVRAANKLNRVQSNVTTRIRQLEEHLGTRLFRREGRSIRLSAEGHTLLTYADRLLRLADETVSEMRAGKPKGVFRLGSLESTAGSRLAPILSRYHSVYPDVVVELATGTTGPLVLLRHEFLRGDGAAIGALQHGHRGRLLTRAPISRRRMVAIEFGM